MNMNARLENVTVVGAAGKMGSGIALLLLRELTWRHLEGGGVRPILNLVDVSDSGLVGLLRYLRDQMVKDAERQVNRLRLAYRKRPDLVENGEMIEELAREAALLVRTGTTLDLARQSRLVFEAVVESEELKTSLYRELAGICTAETFFFTNTSSIPIHVLEEATGLGGRLIGYHFYNPPAVQRLLEVISPSGCDPELRAVAQELGGRLGKTIVASRDVAGFIGNGHFIRDGLHAIREVEQLAPAHGLAPAIAMVDMVSRDWLVRPMGIFQLIDYVGVDVFSLILRVMERHLTEGLVSPLVDRLLSQGIKGGQTASGSQRDGILRYEKGRPTGVWDLEKREYAPIDPAWREVLGAHPDPAVSWKALQGQASRSERLRTYFGALARSGGLGAEIALRYARASQEVALRLVEQGVAECPEDVNAVLELGFFHLYGPINDFLSQGGTT